ncbi:hypothetical protein ABIB42_000706 [Massilia sp. UYP32]|uniref:hypothetical protein n=1 Tax=Massilia sp. UYP32 TaxID=1756386 RepID=UPI003D1BF601
MSVQQFFEKVCNSWPNIFPDLAWSKDKLTFPLPPQKISSIRFELQEKEYLHLKDMQMFRGGADNFEKIDIGTAEIRTSSCFNGAENYLTEKAFVNGANFIGFHTDQDETPWAEVTFPEPISSAFLQLSNRNDKYAKRSRTLRIICILDSGEAITLYDAVARVTEAERWLLQQYLNIVGQLDAQYEKIAELLINIARWNVSAASETFSTNQVFRPYRHDLNKIAQLYNLEFTIHGLKRSFRYWSIEEKKEYLRFGKTVSENLESIGAKVAFGFGAALGYVRKGDFIDHDDDLDLIVGFDKETTPSLTVALGLIEKNLRSHGYKVEGNFFSHRWVYFKNGFQLDIFAGLIEGENVSFYPSRRNAYKTHDIFPAAIMDFLGVNSPMPNNIMEYLRKTYGADWRIPNSSFGHRWDESEYSDIK